MSSLVGHLMIGAALASRNRLSGAKQRFIACGVLMGLAIAPDLDYPLYWFLNWQIEPRISHSLGFCVFVIGSLSLLKASSLMANLQTIPYSLMTAAMLSHLLLDLLVGVHPMPLLWPFIDRTWVLSWGILPSAGRLQISNLYLWRNLLIESAITIPICLVISGWFAKPNTARYWKFLAVMSFAIGVGFGANLQR